MERVRWAAQMASADEFIERLPFGYDTRDRRDRAGALGRPAAAHRDRPRALSPSRRSSSSTRRPARSTPNRSARSSTTSTRCSGAAPRSSSRTASARSATPDLIVVLEQGRLVEQGTHDELMRRHGLYYYLASQQLGIVMSTRASRDSPPFLDPDPPPWAVRALASVLLLALRGRRRRGVRRPGAGDRVGDASCSSRCAAPIRSGSLHRGTVAEVRVADAQARGHGRGAVRARLRAGRRSRRPSGRRVSARLSGGRGRLANERSTLREPAAGRRAGAAAPRAAAGHARPAGRSSRSSSGRSCRRWPTRKQREFEAGVVSWLDANRPQARGGPARRRRSKQLRAESADARNALERLALRDGLAPRGVRRDRARHCRGADGRTRHARTCSTATRGATATR